MKKIICDLVSLLTFKQVCFGWCNTNSKKATVKKNVAKKTAAKKIKK